MTLPWQLLFIGALLFHYFQYREKFLADLESGNVILDVSQAKSWAKTTDLISVIWTTRLVEYE